MKQKDIVALVMVGFFAAILSFFISGALFSPKKYSSEVPTAQPISPTLPDVANDPTYSSIFNPQALDLTVPVQIGNSQNETPFN